MIANGIEIDSVYQHDPSGLQIQARIVCNDFDDGSSFVTGKIVNPGSLKDAENQAGKRWSYACIWHEWTKIG